MGSPACVAAPPTRRRASHITTPGGVPAVQFGAVPAASPLWQQQHQGTPSPVTSSSIVARKRAARRLATPGTRPSVELRQSTTQQIDSSTPRTSNGPGAAPLDAAGEPGVLPCPEQAPTTHTRPCDSASQPMAQPSGREDEINALKLRLRQLEDKLASSDRLAAGLAAENASLREHQADASSSRRSSTGELDGRLAAASTALWDGARRVAELAAERRELAERCARAEAAARAARDSCERLAARLASTLGPASGASRAEYAPTTPASQRPSGDSSLARDALLTLGRKRFEQRSARKQSPAILTRGAGNGTPILS